MSSGKPRKIILHLIATAMFLSIPLVVAPRQVGLGNFWQQPMWQRGMILYLLLAGFFYFNYFLLVPKLYFRKKWLLYVLAIMACYLVVRTIPRAAMGDLERAEHLHHEHVDRHRFEQPHPIPREGIFAQFLLVLTLSILLKTRIRLNQIQDEKMRAEVLYLKEQINPHFLFNSLNSLYALALKKSDVTPDAILMLSNMMRYVVTETRSEKVPLERELSYISDYIRLQKLRVTETPNLSVHVEGDPKNLMIAPLLLIPYIENAFKYGVDTDGLWKIDIFIAISDSKLTLEVTNRKVKVAFADENTLQSGQEGARKRLKYLYPSKHSLEIRDTPDEYHVTLKIDLA